MNRGGWFWIAFCLGMFAYGACVPADTQVDGAELLGTAATLERCQAEGRAHADAGNAAVISAYNACKRDAGL